MGLPLFSCQKKIHCSLISNQLQPWRNQAGAREIKSYSVFLITSKDFDIYRENVQIWTNTEYNLLTGRWHWRWKGALHLAAAGLVRLDGWGGAPLSLEQTHTQKNQGDSEGLKILDRWDVRASLVEICCFKLKSLFTWQRLWTRRLNEFHQIILHLNATSSRQD